HWHRVPAADVPHDSAHVNPSLAVRLALALSVHDAPELALRQSWRREPALPELGRYQRPDLVVLALALLQFDVTPADELLDGLAEVRRHVGYDPDRRGLRKAGRGGQVAREVPRERICEARAVRVACAVRAAGGCGRVWPRGAAGRHYSAGRTGLAVGRSPAGRVAGVLGVTRSRHAYLLLAGRR